MTLPAFTVKAIDTTGAGDNFAAGFITAMLEGGNIRECCEFGAAAAGICCEHLGANSGVRNRSQVKDFITKQKELEKIGGQCDEI